MVRPPGRVPLGINATNAILRAFEQRALWLQRITEHTPGAAATAGRDTRRGQETTQNDGSFGVGWQVTQYGVLRKGYLAPVALRLAVLDNQQLETWAEQGIQLYEGPVALVGPATPLLKQDLLIMLTDTRRFVVGDLQTPYQVLGATVLNMYRLEKRNPADIVFSVPTV